MLIILPPSETKAHGGDGSPLKWDCLSFPQLNPVREAITNTLVDLPIDEAMATLGLSRKLRGEAESNKRLLISPTMPAIQRFTGVLYDALDACTLGSAARSRLVVGDALFGLVSAEDMIPHYRLSGGTKLEGRTMKSRWGSAITEVLTRLQGQGELIVDMRSGAYQQLGKLPGAITVRVESVRTDGSRTVVSHFNKRYKGELARALALADAASPSASTALQGCGGAGGIDELARIATKAGMTVEVRGTQLVVVVTSSH